MCAISDQLVDPSNGHSPRVARRIEMLVMTAARQLDKLCCGDRCGVGAADLYGNIAIRVAVDQEMRDVRRLIDGRRGALLEQGLNAAGTGAKPCGQAQVCDGSLSDDASSLDIERSQQRQITPCAVADDGRGDGIDLHLEFLQCPDGKNDVLVTLGPPAARTEAAVFNVPRGVSVRHEIGGDVVLQIASVPLLPAPAVDEDDGTRDGLGAGEPEVRDLFPVGAV
jgi:hypothetical protein